MPDTPLANFAETSASAAGEIGMGRVVGSVRNPPGLNVPHVVEFKNVTKTTTRGSRINSLPFAT